MSWRRMTGWLVLAILGLTLSVAAQEREKTKNKTKGTRPAARDPAGARAPADTPEFPAAKVTGAEKGKISFESYGARHTLSVSLNTRFFDAEGHEVDPITGSIRFLLPGNIVAISTRSPSKGERTIAQIRFVSGKLGELPTAALDLDELKPDPKEAGSEINSKLRDKDWNAYYAHAQVGDFILYRQGDEPGRREIVEVGEEYVIEAKVFYVLGTRDEDRIRYQPAMPQPGAGGDSEGKKPSKSDSSSPSASAKTAKSPASKAPSKSSKSTSPSKAKLTPAQRREQAKAKTSSKSSGSAPAALPETETLTVAGRELVCTIRRNTAGDYHEWICPDVPFDGKVKDDSRRGYELLDFGRGK